MERSRPGPQAEQSAREDVRLLYPMAASAYTSGGAIVYDQATDAILGSALDGDWSVEWAWQDVDEAIAKHEGEKP